MGRGMKTREKRGDNSRGKSATVCGKSATVCGKYGKRGEKGAEKRKNAADARVLLDTRQKIE